MQLRRNTLGNTGMNVTDLCFGALPMGPLQLNMDLQSGVALIRRALESGINFIDTAQGYMTYPYIRPALEHAREHIFIATKSTATGYEQMDAAVKEALRELGREHIDIFHLHAARATANVLDERMGALRCLCDYREKGIIGAVGISTHSVAAVRAAIESEDIDVIFPIINIAGFGILDGTKEDMAQAISDAARRGKGVYAMKALGGGNLIGQTEQAIAYVRALPGVASVALGMVSTLELEMNLDIFFGKPIRQRVPHSLKKMRVQRFCVGCGKCIETCANGAITIMDNKAVIDMSRCITCGYCAPGCPQFAIRMV